MAEPRTVRTRSSPGADGTRTIAFNAVQDGTRYVPETPEAENTTEYLPRSRAARPAAQAARPQAAAAATQPESRPAAARRPAQSVQGEGRAGPEPEPAEPAPALTPDALPPPPDMTTIADTLKSMKFRKAVFGGVEEADVWRQLENLQRQYQAVYDAQRAYYKALLTERDRALARQMRKR